MDTKNARDKAKSYITRLMALRAQKAETQADITELCNEAKDAGFSPKHIRAVAKLAEMDSGDREEHLFLLESYSQAFGLPAQYELQLSNVTAIQDPLVPTEPPPAEAPPAAEPKLTAIG